MSHVTNAGSDLELVRLIRKGDERAARELWARIGPSLLRVAEAVSEDRAAAEDAVQQAMCRLLELRERQVREIRDVGAFLACMVRRLALNDRRGEARLQRRGRETGANVAGVQASADESPAASRLREAIDALPDELSEVVLLRHVGGLTFDQLALVLGQNRSTIAGRYRRAIGELERRLAGSDQVPAHPAMMRVGP